MKFVTPRDFAAAQAWDVQAWDVQAWDAQAWDAQAWDAQAWDAMAIAEIEGATIRLHWADRPYVWHVNDGAEVFVLLDGAVTMHYRHAGREYRQAMQPGDICHAEPGDEHVAHPTGVARILVIEKKRSV